MTTTKDQDAKHPAHESPHLCLKWEFNASYGIAPLDRGRFLIAQNTTLLAGDGKTKLNQARLVIANADEKAGLVIVKP